MLQFVGKLKPRIKSESDACEALRQLKEMTFVADQVAARLKAERKALEDSIADDLALVQKTANEDLAIEVSGKPSTIPEYKAALNDELVRWARGDMSVATYTCPHGTVAVRSIPSRVDAPGVDQKDREKNRPSVVARMWESVKAGASEWLAKAGLSPFIRLKPELDMDAINKAREAGTLKREQIEEFGLTIVPAGQSVSVKLAE